MLMSLDAAIESRVRTEKSNQKECPRYVWERLYAWLNLLQTLLQLEGTEEQSNWYGVFFRLQRTLCMRAFNDANSVCAETLFFVLFSHLLLHWEKDPYSENWILIATSVLAPMCFNWSWTSIVRILNPTRVETNANSICPTNPSSPT